MDRKKERKNERKRNQMKHQYYEVRKVIEKYYRKK